ncbi:MAG: hypothetical protein PHF24_09705 [Syntrophomonas sp.]|nr:hypothetical protein [Syntrophomonas sp.]
MLPKRIRQIQNDIFAYNIELVPAQLSNLMTSIIDQGAFDMRDINRVQRFNQIMQASLEALQNKDYLLLADLIEYELKTILPDEEFMA